jgi:hypothetical protein
MTLSRYNKAAAHVEPTASPAVRAVTSRGNSGIKVIETGLRADIYIKISRPRDMNVIYSTTIRNSFPHCRLDRTFK